jgi:hypothetical protein
MTGVKTHQLHSMLWTLSRKTIKLDFPLWYHKGSGPWAKAFDVKRHDFGTNKAKGLTRWKEKEPVEVISASIPSGRIR